MLVVEDILNGELVCLEGKYCITSMLLVSKSKTTQYKFLLGIRLYFITWKQGYIFASE